MPGQVAQLDVCLTCNQEVAGWMLWSGNILSLRLILKSFSTLIFSILLIPEGQLSVTGKRIGTEYWLTS